MRRTATVLLALAALLVIPAAGAGAAPAGQNFWAHLTAGQEVPSNASDATGQAIFRLSKDGTALHYRLIASNIDNVVAAHIHMGSAGTNGPVVAFLFGNAAPGGGAQDGVLATGIITAANLLGPLAGQPLSSLVAAMRAGDAYANVHTNDGVTPTNTGPGDLASGEIRGQIAARGPHA